MTEQEEVKKFIEMFSEPLNQKAHVMLNVHFTLIFKWLSGKRKVSLKYKIMIKHLSNGECFKNEEIKLDKLANESFAHYLRNSIIVPLCKKVKIDIEEWMKSYCPPIVKKMTKDPTYLPMEAADSLWKIFGKTRRYWELLILEEKEKNFKKTIDKI